MGDIVTNTGSLLQQTKKSSSKRQLAENLQKELDTKTYIRKTGKKQRKGEFLAKMLGDLVVHGSCTTSEGEVLSPKDFKEWFDAVKFIHTHMDGPASNDTTFQGVQIFKVYAGIDVDEV